MVENQKTATSQPNKMKLLEKINHIRVAVVEAAKKGELEKSGKNKGIGYKYAELADITPITTPLEKELGLYLHFDWNEKNQYYVEIIDIETDKSIRCTFRELEGEKLVGRSVSVIQDEGSLETYLRRYALLRAYNIAIPDSIDSGENNNDEPKAKAKPKEEPKPTDPLAKLRADIRELAAMKDQNGYVSAKLIDYGWIENGKPSLAKADEETLNEMYEYLREA